MINDNLLALEVPEAADEADAHGVACLAVLEHAILLARVLLRDRLAACQQRELYCLMDAIHNVPAAAGGTTFWDRERVVKALAGYDAQFALPSQHQHPERKTLRSIYCATHDARMAWRASVREAQRQLSQRRDDEQRLGSCGG